jgi:hypothetical protein
MRNIRTSNSKSTIEKAPYMPKTKMDVIPIEKIETIIIKIEPTDTVISLDK